MTTSMYRRQWLQILGLACIPQAPICLPRQVQQDLHAVTRPDALLAMDWGDMARIREHWGLSPWHCSVTACHVDLGAMLTNCCQAVGRHQHALGTAPAMAVIVLRGNGAGFSLAKHMEVFAAIRSTVKASTELWYGAACDPALVDAMRVTVVVDGD